MLSEVHRSNKTGANVSFISHNTMPSTNGSEQVTLDFELHYKFKSMCYWKTWGICFRKGTFFICKMDVYHVENCEKSKSILGTKNKKILETARIQGFLTYKVFR